MYLYFELCNIVDFERYLTFRCISNLFYMKIPNY